MASIDQLIGEIENAQTYEAWITLSKQLDDVNHRALWQAEDSSPLYDYMKLHALLSDLRQARLQKDVTKLLYLVRTALSRNVANMGDPRLFNYAQSGTKYLVDEFINECELVLETLTTVDGHLSSEVLHTLVQSRKAFGRTALVLSGGSILGFLHIGVARELIENNLLPKIISGSSAGSIFASMLCIHRDEEFETMWELLSIPMSIFGPAGEQESLATHFKRFCTVGTWIDSIYLKEMMQGLIGDVTFQEAYNRTGRILNVTVSVSGSHDMPRLLNYLTAPNVVIWSAVVCSCSVPFVFAADSIFAKNPKTKELYPWSKRAFIDGSVDNDMPLTRLSEMFNVNHFLASQVNPHVAPLFTDDRGSPDVEDALEVMPHKGANGLVTRLSKLDNKKQENSSRWLGTKISKGIENGKTLLFNELEHGLTLLKAAGITPSVASTLLNVIGQEYWGDITIVPQIYWSDVSQLFRNPSAAQISELVSRGRKATWPKLALIRNHCAIEVAFDKAIVELRSKVIATVYTPVHHSPLSSLGTKEYLHRKQSYSAPRSRSHHGSAHGPRSLSVTNLPSLHRRASSKPSSPNVSKRRASFDALYETISRRSSEL